MLADGWRRVPIWNDTAEEGATSHSNSGYVSLSNPFHDLGDRPYFELLFFYHSCRYGFNGCHIQPRHLTFWVDEKTGELEATIALLSQHHHFKSSGLYEELERWDCAVPVRNSSDGSLELTYGRFSGEGTINGNFTDNMTNEDILRIDQITIPDLITPSSTVTTTAITQNSSSNRPKVVDTTIWVCRVPILAFFFRNIWKSAAFWFYSQSAK